MRSGILIAGAAALALCCSLLVAIACGDAGPKSGESRGVVTAVDPAARTITLDHQDIPGMMSAMTMTFHVAPDVSLDGVEPGAKVGFRVKYEGNAYTVTEIRR